LTLPIWITGAAGFLGSSLVPVLAERGLRAIPIPRQRIDLAASEAPLQLCELLAAEGAPPAVVHLASRQPGAGSLADFVRSNVLATAQLLDALAGTDTRFIFASTLSVHARPESEPRAVSPASPVAATNAYSATKLAAENLIHVQRRSAPALVLRFPSLYGIAQRDSFIDGLARQLRSGEAVELFGRGENYRDALPVEDAVAALLLALERPLPPGVTTLTLGNGAPVTSADYAAELARLLGSTSTITRADRPVAPFLDLYADLAAARSVLGFEPTPWREALERYVHELPASS
jgi:nucleoside-diphosphate-sugar epimerase